MTLDLEAIDGCVGEAWSGDVPDGSHINVVLARRGSATAAAGLTALAQPRPGHAPLVVCLGAGNDRAHGGAGADLVRGGPGRDLILGGPGPDLLVGNGALDLARGGPGQGLR